MGIRDEKDFFGGKRLTKSLKNLKMDLISLSVV